MKEDVGMSKPKKHANKVRWDLKLNKPLPYSTAQVQLLVFCFILFMYGYIEVVCLILGPT